MRNSKNCKYEVAGNRSNGMHCAVETDAVSTAQCIERKRIDTNYDAHYNDRTRKVDDALYKSEAILYEKLRKSLPA